MKIQRDCLNGELQKKTYYLLLDEEIIDKETDYDAYIKLNPESLKNLKEKGKNVEYKEIDYIDLFRHYCIDWDSYDKYLCFCEKYSIIPVKETLDYDKLSKTPEFLNYFPKGVFNQVQNEILSSFLDYFDPVSIVHVKKGQNEIRFSCIDSGMMRDSYSYIIKVKWTRFSRTMEVIVEDSPARHEKIDISKKELDKLLDLLNECDFYNQQISYDINVNDGTKYVCEVNIDGKYKIVSRWEGSKDLFIFLIHDFLIKKTGGAPHHGKQVWKFLRN
ncbi:MAG: hypothetical protein IKX23_04855 [Treponema sp.]|nr:hypothetical protein [Treponema sp.]